MHSREKDIQSALTQIHAYDHRDAPVTGKAVDYPKDFVGPRHQHPTAQLIYAVHGVMVVSTDQGQWIVPPTRGIWMPPHTDHWTRMVGEVRMRTVYIWEDAAPGLPNAIKAVAISPLLRELILAAIDVPESYTPDSRDGRVMQLLLDEIALLPTLPLHLPTPTDPRLIQICETISRVPDDDSTLSGWAERFDVDPKTIQRLFARQTGMTFGQWRQQARLLMGLEQLATGARVIDVALNLGYESPSAFATMFKRQFGETPTQYFR
jgi:AraC-like DNA-binding protein/quercetin dioxygenase-like cupin family protein